MTTAQPSPTHRRRWLSFSLRGLLLVVTAACIWLAIVSTRARKQEQAVTKVEALGGGLHFNYQRDRRGRRLPKGEPPAPEWLRRAVGEEYFRRVVTVDFNLSRSRKATDEDLAIFCDLTDVETLELNNNAISDAGLKHLSGLKQLRTLYLYRSKVRGPGLEHLPRGLLFLTLEYTPLEDEGLAHLRHMPALSSLSIAHTRITDRGLAHLRDLPVLKRLEVNHTRITDEGLKHLSQMTSLETVNLGHTDITDDGLKHLNTLTNLKSLWLDRTKVTGRGVRQLRKSLPNCSISPEPDWLDATPKDVELWPEDYKPSESEILAKVAELGDADVKQNAPGQPIVSFRLFDSAISDESLIRLLKEMPDLEQLNLRHVVVGDRLAKELPRLKKLWFLSLGDSRITDEGLRYVGQLTSLRELSLSYNEITDDGLIHLAGLVNLRNVDTDQCDISEEGYASFQQLLPRCRITR